MTTINLRDYYPNYYSDDTFVEVSNEIAVFFAEEKRLQTNYAQYIRDNRAFYSLDAGDGIENKALERPEQPDENLECKELSDLLNEALDTLPEAQRRRIYANIICEVAKTAIAEAEGVDESSVRITIARGLRSMKKYLKKFL